ncbi:hypothetical protein [Maridesulfovibrio sp.]|uniref:hypothetical protein n=1 Tax=Maridesulfovibrio sp. TaxID=2795000 RepID=UPI0029CA5FFA|nr:hypothetical protein [Maridesulfovibrio sp.]
MDSVVVRTKDELEQAMDEKAPVIVVQGELAEDLNKGMKLSSASAVTLGLLGAALAAVPFTGGLSLLAAAPIAAMTGLEIALIVAVAALGLALVLTVLKDYKKASFTRKGPEGETELVLERE